MAAQGGARYRGVREKGKGGVSERVAASPLLDPDIGRGDEREQEEG
jgi:hypothetical protein